MSAVGVGELPRVGGVVVTNDAPGRELEYAQRDVGEGPCLDTLLADEPTSSGS